MFYSNICAWKLASHHLEVFDVTGTLQERDVSVIEGAVGNINCPGTVFSKGVFHMREQIVFEGSSAFPG